VLHLCGNLRHFIGAVLGNSGYVRDREAEFSRRDVPRADLLALVEAAKTDVTSAMARMDDAAMHEAFPVEYGGTTVRIDLFLTHLLSHLAFHLGQIDYHRRAALADATSANPIAAESLAAAPSAAR